MRDSYSFDKDYTGMKEIIYLLTDPAIPVLVRTGITTTGLKERVKFLSSHSGSHSRVALKMIETSTRTSLLSPILSELSL